MIKKPDGKKWKLTKLDYYKHEKLRLEKSLENYKIKSLKFGHMMPKVTNYVIQKHEKKIKELELKIKLEEMKQP